MQPLQLISTEDNERNSALASQRLLDDSRAIAMEAQLHGKPLAASLTTIAECLESILGSCHSQTLAFDTDKDTFRALNKNSGRHPTLIENIIVKLLNNTELEFGKNIKLGREAIFSDIYTFKAWQKMHIEAKELGIVACWVTPILNAQGKIYGAFVTLFNTMRDADKGELALLQRAAQSVSALIHHSKAKAKELQQKVALHQDCVTQKIMTDEANNLLKKAIVQRAEVQGQLLELENMAALGTMMSSLTHEINTPIGVSLTAAGFLSDMQDSCFDKLQNEQLKRSELITYLKESTEASDIIERNMLRADVLIKTFKRLSVDQHSQDVRTFGLCDYIYEVLLSLKPRLKHTPHKFCIDIPSDLTVHSNPGALSQLLINLIMNSAHHAFPLGVEGRITIAAKLDYDEYRHKQLVITYKDNGKGMNKQTIENMYKPFFTLARETDGCGLGMHICNNIVMKVLRGTIDCHSEMGKGVEFTIAFPV
jgi:signal transduction histidine kinase